MIIKNKYARAVCCYYLPRSLSSLSGKVKGNGINTYWSRLLNFGDQLTPILLKHYGFTPIFTNPGKAKFVSIGSILEHLPENYSGIIFGSGFIHENSCMTFPNSNVIGVRGILTRDRLCLKHQSAILGDPGLLASRLLVKRETKTYMLGIIPHYIDKNNHIINMLINKYSRYICKIDVQQAPIKVIRSIDRCHNIISSSLHGLVIADSLEIPNTWLFCSGLVGGHFKFYDYYSSLSRQAVSPIIFKGDETLNQLIGYVAKNQTDKIKEIIEKLHWVWSDLHTYIRD